jgi:subtilase family serine protease
MRRVRARLFLLVIGLALSIVPARPAMAGDAATILESNHPDEAADIAGQTNASPTAPLEMRLTMALRNRAELTRLLADQQDPASPDYHRWLTPDQFAARFGPTDADLARVARWLKKKGFTIKSADASTREITFTGSVAQAQTGFAVKIAATCDGRNYANTTDPAVPADLAPLIESIDGLDNMLHSQPAVTRVSKRDASASSPNFDNGQGEAFGPADLYTFYDETPLLNDGINGSGGGCIAVIEDSNLDDAAAAAFNTQFDLPALTASNFQVVLVDGSDPGLNQDQTETMVDVNYSHSIAPGSDIRIYLGNQNRSKSSAILDAIQAAVMEKNGPCSAISISFSFCGGSKGFYKTQSNLFEQATAQGRSVFVATGDLGAAGLKFNAHQGTCAPATTKGINELAGSPNVTAIGGTEFTPQFDGDGNDVGFVPESVWNDGSGATGGGASKVFKKPAFQKGVFKKDKKRDIPDISFAASADTPGFFLGGRAGNGNPAVVCCVGGTSVGAPAWAGISQLMSQQNGNLVGNLNTRIYQLGAEANGAATGIRDVTSGNNSFNGVAGFSAGPGYDKATGWGTVDLGLFVPAFLAQ